MELNYQFYQHLPLLKKLFSEGVPGGATVEVAEEKAHEAKLIVKAKGGLMQRLVRRQSVALRLASCGLKLAVHPQQSRELLEDGVMVTVQYVDIAAFYKNHPDRIRYAPEELVGQAVA